MADRLAARSVCKVVLNPDKVNYRIYSAVEKGNEIVEAAVTMRCLPVERCPVAAHGQFFSMYSLVQRGL